MLDETIFQLLWYLLEWRFRLFFCLKTAEHSSHLNTADPWFYHLWMYSSCLFLLPDWLNDLPHPYEHLNGFSPLWAIRWPNSECVFGNVLMQPLQSQINTLTIPLGSIQYPSFVKAGINVRTLKSLHDGITPLNLMGLCGSKYLPLITLTYVK